MAPSDQAYEMVSATYSKDLIREATEEASPFAALFEIKRGIRRAIVNDPSFRRAYYSTESLSIDYMAFHENIRGYGIFFSRNLERSLLSLMD